jgi:hypothetical protein
VAIFAPSMLETGTGIIATIAADVALGGTSEILTALAPSGASFPLNGSTKDTGEFEKLKFGGREQVPDGFSILVVPQPFEQRWDSSPRGLAVMYKYQLELYFKDQPPDGTTMGLTLTKTPGLLHRMLVDAAEAVMKVVGPEGLMNTGGSWDVTGDGDFLSGPFVNLTVPSGQFRIEKAHEDIYYSLISWMAEKYWNF